MSAQTQREQIPAQVEEKLEVVIIPVSDVERSKQFYEKLGWRLDADFRFDGARGIQFTPPGSQCSIIFGDGATPAPPGSQKGLMLIVDDIEKVREDLGSRGVQVSEVFHFDSGIHADNTGRVPGPPSDGRSYQTWASFNDPDGNSWLLQEVKTRLPGRVTPPTSDIKAMTDLLREAEQHHGSFEANAPKHHWSDFYSAYIVAREHGASPDEAAKDAAEHVRSRQPS